MPFLETLASSGDPKFTDQWNRLVRSIKALQKMRGDGLVNVTWVSGVPTIHGKKLADQAGIGKANGSISNRATGAISIWEGTFGSEVDSTIDTDMFNLGPSVSSGDWVQWQIVNDQFAFVKLCS